MTKLFSVIFKSAFAFLFLCSAIPVFAQRGGGGHAGGGGFHGGGGGFHGRGMSPSGGGFHAGSNARVNGGPGFRGGSSPPPAGAGAPRSLPNSSMRSGNSAFARPGGSAPQSSGNFARGGQRFGTNSTASAAVADGQWHSFGGQARGPSSSPSEMGSANHTGEFHVFGGNREAGSAGSVRSFSGQGGQVWENSPATRNIVPRSQSLSTLHSSFAGSPAARLSAPLPASARSTGGSVLASSRRLPGTINQTNSFRRPFGASVFPRNGFGRGCWNCGFGFGGWRGAWGWRNNWGWGFWGGWGFGWPWLGFWGWDPFIYDPWWGWPAPGYGYYGYNNNYVYGSSTAGNPAPENDSTPTPAQDRQDNSSGSWITPSRPSLSSPTNSEILTVPFLIYMKTGEIYTVRDYWMVDGKFYYLRMDGAERAVNLEEVDLARTNTENAKSGVKFIFKSAPSAAPISPDENVAPPATTEPSPSPKTDHENDQTSQPEART